MLSLTVQFITYAIMSEQLKVRSHSHMKHSEYALIACLCERLFGNLQRYLTFTDNCKRKLNLLNFSVNTAIHNSFATINSFM